MTMIRAMNTEIHVPGNATQPQASSDARLRRYEIAVVQDSQNPMPLYKLGDAHRKRGDVDAWSRCVRAAFELEHITSEQLYFRARAKLTMGEWSGWNDYEARCDGPYFLSQQTALARELRWSHAAWNGIEGLQDKTLLVVHEQGLGDDIQMLRFLPVLADKALRVVTLVKPRLVPLVQHNFGHRVQVAIEGMPLSVPFDRYAQAMSLPALIGGLPPFERLSAPLSQDRRSTPNCGRVRAGLCWAGNPSHPRDRERSMTLAALAPILARPEIEWVSLQVGESEAEADEYESLSRPDEPLVTFAQTADLITSLDLVVSVDTAVAHLAGCLGTPTYVLLPSAATWRWGLGVTTPWYPTMRLIRQRASGDWPSAVDELTALLDARSDNRHAGRS